jgi:hypothetical protein
VKVKKFEGDMSDVRRSTNNFTFQVETSQVFLIHTSQHEWVVYSGYAHHMTNDVSLFSYSDKAVEQKM